MRRSGPWQSVWDDRILEWMLENEGSGTASEMKDVDEIQISRSQISRRLKKLAEHGLVREIGNGAYVITDEGEGYLDEEYDAANEVWLNQDHTNGPDSAPSGPTPEEAGNGGDGAL
jgi:hypothetical protein